MKKIKKLFERELPFIFMCPAILWQVLFLYIPLVLLLGYSLSEYIPEIKKFVFTLRHYKQILQPFSLKILGNSFFLAFQTSAISFLIAYPLAYFLTFKVKRFRTFYLLLVILPSWTSLIIQIYAWFFLLKKDGIISQTLYQFGLISNPIHILNNNFSILIGMVYCYFPFMVLPIYSVLEKIDRRLIEASSDLGASRWMTIKKVILPLSYSGIIAGLFLVFIPAFGEFAIPEFLGGSKKLFWGNVIVSKFLDSRDWSSGAAATYSGFLFPILIFALFYFMFRVAKKSKTGYRKRGYKNG